LKEKLLATGQYHHIVSHTTRQPRINHGVLEQDGREYHFIDLAKAEQMLDDKLFVEAKQYSGNVYGTSVAEIQAAHDEGKVAVTDLEVQGVAEYKAIDANIMAVFLLPPDFATWQGRLERRYGDVVDAVDHRRRLKTALDEIEQLLVTDYYTAIVNDDLEATFEAVQSLVRAKSQPSEQKNDAHKVAENLAHDIREYLNA